MNRPKLFDEPDDLSRFAPVPPPEQVRQVAEAAGFHSREPQQAARPPREPYRYRTGRTEQFSARIRPEHYDRFYAIARSKGWKLGETVEKALEALEEKLGQGS